MSVRPREKVFNTYWNFAAERQRVFHRRLHGYPHPWTEDEIIGNYRFCNAFRASDRVSQYLIRHVIYGDHLSQDPENILFRLLLFRFFNLSETWDLLESLYGDPNLSNFDVDKWYKDMDTGQGLFNGAYMLCGVKIFGYEKKHGNYLGLVKHMVDEGLIQRIIAAKSFEEIYRDLNSFKLVGKFLAYQIATDINYSGVVDFPEDSFTMAGPGAERGIAKVFESTGGKSPEEMIHWMRERQEEEFTTRGIPLDIAWLWGRPLQAIDIQNLFCETDKYCRVRFPELASGRSRIKAGFKVNPTKATLPFYPPKWGINDKLDQLPAVEKVANPDDDLPWAMEW
jgi:hypothetical protein